MIPETFQQHRAANGDSLVIPDCRMHGSSWVDWPTRWLRSMHLDSADRVVSVGFPKFLNLNEGAEGSLFRVEPKDLIAAEDVYATHKIDGSLIIRYVRDGRVCFRTRGSLEVGIDCWSVEAPGFRAKYPALFDPSVIPEGSTLLEYVTPLNKIVIEYPKPDLVLIGHVAYLPDAPWHDAHCKLASLPQLQLMAQSLGVRVTDHFMVGGDTDIESLISSCKAIREHEGYVLRFGERMVKVKTAHYLKLHGLKSNLDTERMIGFWVDNGRPDRTRFRETFEAQYDWEVYQYALPAINAMYDGVDRATQQISAVSGFVESTRTVDRKAFALAAQSQFQSPFLSVCFMLYDSKEIPGRLWHRLVSDNTEYINKSMFSES